MGGGLESRCLGHVYGVDGAVRVVLSSWGVVRSLTVKHTHMLWYYKPVCV